MITNGTDARREYFYEMGSHPIVESVVRNGAIQKIGRGRAPIPVFRSSKVYSNKWLTVESHEAFFHVRMKPKANGNLS